MTLVNMMELDMIVGSGGVLSHAPMRAQAALMMLDAYQPEGVTILAVDSIFMMPQLGILSTVHPEAATQVFERDCLIMLGTAVAPVGNVRAGETACTLAFQGGQTVSVKGGELAVVPLGVGEQAEVEILPARGLNVGAGKGKPLRTTVRGGVVGVIVDCRGRPLVLPSEPEQRISRQTEWMRALGLPLPQGRK
jgi:hypothetical protein